MRINGIRLDWHELHDKLQRLFGKRVERVAYVRADGEVMFRDVAAAIDIARGADIQTIGLLTERSVPAR